MSVVNKRETQSICECNRNKNHSWIIVARALVSGEGCGIETEFQLRVGMLRLHREFLSCEGGGTTFATHFHKTL